MRLRPFIAVGCAGALLAGCGDETPPPKPQKPVQLQISAPVDTAVVQGATMQVRGTVSPPGARVRVQGHAAQVSGAAALTAFRVTREERVGVPDLAGLSVDDAEDAAKQRDLKLEAERGGGFLDSLVPRRIGVCEQSPAPGKQVRRGTTVRVLVARAC